MADDRDPESPAPDSANTPDRANEGPAQIPPPGDETQKLPAAGETQKLPAAGETEKLAAAGETRAMPAADETRAMPSADETGRIPAADETAPVPPQPEAWSGRAGVPPPAAAVRGPAPTEWAPAPDDGGGKWWMPIVVGIVGLLLLAGLVTGIWLIYNTNKVEPSQTPTPSPTSAPTSGPATSAAPTTSPPPPPTTAPAGVPMPRLVGLNDQEARDELDELGLSYRLVYRPAEEPPDTVIETDPAEGEVVLPGTEVTLVIASPLTPSDPPTTAPTSVEPSPTS